MLDKAAEITCWHAWDTNFGYLVLSLPSGGTISRCVTSRTLSEAKSEQLTYRRKVLHEEEPQYPSSSSGNCSCCPTHFCINALRCFVKGWFFCKKEPTPLEQSMSSGRQFKVWTRSKFKLLLSKRGIIWLFNLPANRAVSSVHDRCALEKMDTIMMSQNCNKCWSQNIFF